MVMSRCQEASSAPTALLLILISLNVEPTISSQMTADTQSVSDHTGPPSPGLMQLEMLPFQTEEGQELSLNEENEEDELFKDVDPKTLAAVLLEALNKPRGEKNSEGEENEEVEDKEKEERELQGADRDRDGRQELELVMTAAAAQGKEEQEREEEQERKRAEEEEERLTEKVTSRTTSQTVPVKAQPVVEEVALKEEAVKEEQQQEVGGATEGGEEEQLSPEEVKNLQSMLQELQSYSTATKRERDSTEGQRESRGSYLADLAQNDLIYNDMKPKPKGYDLALSKKKLKWQQEQEKNKNRPLYRGGNFMDDFNDNLTDPEEEEDEDDEEELSPEEEEARAKAEQEEVRRQAAEAQRAKAEEEKLADIASDMLLQYMVKQDGKKYQDQRKNSLGSNAAEDKRSDEEVTSDDDDDIDPQTIDKLIEISSKLHLPADDVVDIISDVEKKKKKDAPETPPWQRPLVPPSAPAAPAPVLRHPPPAKQPKLNTNALKAWLKDKTSIKPSKQDFWIKQQRPFQTYPTYPFYQKPFRGYYPFYIPPPKPKPRYYAKPSSFNDVLGNSLDYDLNFSPKRRYRPWVQQRLRNPPAFRRNLYFPNYIIPHPRTFKAVPMPKPRSPPRRRPIFYYPPSAPIVTRKGGYYGQLGKPQQDSDEDLENFIEKVFLKHPRMFQ